MKSGPRGSRKASVSNESAARESEPTLPPWKAFVVQFSRETSTTAGVFSGRVEHLNSAHRIRFSSPEELLAVLTRLLDEVASG